MPKPANPTIVIGLGGTGQWVLTYVKKNLVDTYGHVPPTVKLLSFDTTSEKTEAKVEKGEEHAKVGKVELDPSEFIYLGGNIRPFAEEIRKEHRHPHISSWFQAAYYMEALDADAFELSKGAGQRRPFGRMSVFYDLTQSPSQIVNKIEQAIKDVNGQNERRQPIEIYVVCSLAGGTGSGMVLDVAHITRALAGDLGVQFAIRAFLVLQNTFQSVIAVNQIKANSFAAMRELDRFLMVFDRDYPIFYEDDTDHRTPQAVYRSIYHSKLFDNCYLLDATRKNMPLDNSKPWLGVFPAVAECITALMDPETGDTFNQHYKNVNNRLAQEQVKAKKALYSSLGSYTFILPVEDIVETLVHQSAVELLGERLFKIRTDDNTGAEIVTAENQIEAGETPRDAAMNFFKADKSPAGTPNFPFIQQMAATLDQGRLDDIENIKYMAQRGLELVSWLMPVESDESINQISNSIQSIMDASLKMEVQNSKQYKDDFHSGADRIAKHILDFREKKLGTTDSNQRHAPGDLEKGLSEWGARNRKRFRKLLLEKLNQILNGEASDPVIAKTGKLPYALEILQKVMKALEEFDKFLKQVLAFRANSSELAQARDDSTRTKQNVYYTRDMTGLLDRLKNTALTAQNEYIAAEEYLFGLEREDVLYRAMSDYTAMLRQIVEDAAAQLNRWKDVLTLGGAVDSNEKGSYALLRQQQEDLKRRRDEQSQVRVYSYLTNDAYEKELYKRYMDDKWGDVLRRFKWEIRLLHTDDGTLPVAEDGQVQYRYRWEKIKDSDFQVKLLYGNEEFRQITQQQMPASVFNARFIADKLKPYFTEVRSETVADRLQEFRAADGLALEMLNNTSEMILYDPAKQPYREKHNFVCVNRGVQINYFDELAEKLRGHAPSDKDNQVISLTNRHRCVVLSTVDLIVGQETAPIRDSREVYVNYKGDHRLLHNFPAEVNASLFEEQITKKPVSEQQRLLDPTLVALLEDREMVRRYTLARVFNLLRQESALDDPSKNQFILRLDRIDRSDNSSILRLTPPSPKPSELDAMTEFVFVKVDTDSGSRYIRDVTAGLNLQVTPQRIDEVLQDRMTSFITGREDLVKKFDVLIQENKVLLNDEEPQSRLILLGSFRRFLLREYEKYLRESLMGNADALEKYVDRFLEANSDCCARDRKDADKEAEMRKKLSALIVALLKDTKFAPKNKDILKRILDNYIDDDIKNMRKNADQFTHDIGSVMYVILDEEKQRIDNDKSE
jgi:hypothetical protein